MFRRNKQNTAPQSSTAEHPVIPDTESVVAEKPKPYNEEVRERILAYRAAHDAFVKEAIGRGVPDTELAGLLADAMTARAVPRIVTGLSFRGAGVELKMLDGQVPASALRIRVDRRPDGSFDRAIPELILEPSDVEEPGADTFSVISTGLLPQMDKGEPVDQAMLSWIDAHLATDYGPGTNYPGSIK